jgi:hypothetical protein
MPTATVEEVAMPKIAHDAAVLRKHLSVERTIDDLFKLTRWSRPRLLNAFPFLVAYRAIERFGEYWRVIPRRSP